MASTASQAACPYIYMYIHIYIYMYIYIYSHMYLGHLKQVPGLMVDYLFYWLFGITFCIFTSRYCAVWRSMKALNPYRNGPWIISHLPDIYVALIGQTARQGIFEIAWSLSNMLLFIPWFKYYVTVNPWLQNLDHRFVSQITTSMSDIAPAEHCASILQEIISRAKHHPGRARKAWQRMALVVASG